jgi:hypothetical protein
MTQGDFAELNPGGPALTPASAQAQDQPTKTEKPDRPSVGRQHLRTAPKELCGVNDIILKIS